MNKVVDMMKKFKHFGSDHAILTSLVKMASNFANQDALHRVTAMFEDIKNNLLASLMKLTADEDAAVVAFNEDVANVKITHTLFIDPIRYLTRNRRPFVGSIKFSRHR